jgi:hypothetical protein
MTKYARGTSRNAEQRACSEVESKATPSAVVISSDDGAGRPEPVGRVNDMGVDLKFGVAGTPEERATVAGVVSRDVGRDTYYVLLQCKVQVRPQTATAKIR